MIYIASVKDIKNIPISDLCIIVDSEDLTRNIDVGIHNIDWLPELAPSIYSEIHMERGHISRRDFIEQHLYRLTNGDKRFVMDEYVIKPYQELEEDVYLIFKDASPDNPFIPAIKTYIESYGIEIKYL